jgi:hypothetical protein
MTAATQSVPSRPTQHPSTGGSSTGVVVGALLFVLSLGSIWAVNRQIESYFSELDAANLTQATETFDALVNQQRVRLLTYVQILVDDTRIRTTAMTTGFDEGTIRDILEDLKKASNVNVLAVLDENGKVRAITGAEGLRQVDLSASPVIKAAQEKPASYFWTLPDQVLIIGVAPIRTGPRVSALLLMGTTLGTQELSGIERTLGVHGAIFNGDRSIARSSTDASLVDVFRSADSAGDAGPSPVPGYPDFMTRLTRTNDSATAAKVVWLVQRHRTSKEAHALRVAIWMPAILATATFGLIFFIQRKRKGGVS